MKMLFSMNMCLWQAFKKKGFDFTSLNVKHQRKGVTAALEKNYNANKSAGFSIQLEITKFYICIYTYVFPIKNFSPYY